MVLTSFNQKAYEKDLYEEGVEEGINLGQKEIVLHMLHSGNSPEQIAQLTGIDIEVVKQWGKWGDSSSLVSWYGDLF